MLKLNRGKKDVLLKLRSILLSGSLALRLVATWCKQSSRSTDDNKERRTIVLKFSCAIAFDVFDQVVQKNSSWYSTLIIRS